MTDNEKTINVLDALYKAFEEWQGRLDRIAEIVREIAPLTVIIVSNPVKAKTKCEEIAGLVKSATLYAHNLKIAIASAGYSLEGFKENLTDADDLEDDEEDGWEEIE